MKKRITVYAIMQKHRKEEYLPTIDKYYYRYTTTIEAVGRREEIEKAWNENYCNVAGASVGKKRFFVEENETAESLKQRVGVSGYCLLAGNFL